MNKRIPILLTIAMALGACSTPAPPFPEQVAAMAAPDQDLETAFLRPEDNCYWYMHSGPVETTRLPLRTVGGNPICLKPAT